MRPGNGSFERGFDCALFLWNDGRTLGNISHDLRYDASEFGRGMFAAVEALAGWRDSAEREARAWGYSREEAERLIQKIDAPQVRIFATDLAIAFDAIEAWEKQS